MMSILSQLSTGQSYTLRSRLLAISTDRLLDLARLLNGLTVGYFQAYFAFLSSVPRAHNSGQPYVELSTGDAVIKVASANMSNTNGLEQQAYQKITARATRCDS